MAVTDLISIQTILSSLIVSLIVLAIGEYIRRRRKEKQRARDWYGKTKGQLSNLQQAAGKSTAYRHGVNESMLANELSPLDRDMMMQANDPPERVEDGAQAELAIVAAYATGLSSLSERSSEVDALDFVQRVQADAIQNYDGDYDMEDVEDLFEGLDFDELAKEMDREVELNDERADEILSRFSKESLEAGRPTSIEEALNIPIEDVRQAFEEKGVIHDAVDTALEAFVNIVVDLAKDAHERMELRQERI